MTRAPPAERFNLTSTSLGPDGHTRNARGAMPQNGGSPVPPHHLPTRYFLHLTERACNELHMSSYATACVCTRCAASFIARLDYTRSRVVNVNRRCDVCGDLPSL